MSLSIQMEIKRNCLTIRLSGELDQSNVGSLKKRVAEIVKKYSIVNLVFNFKDLEFVGRYAEVKRKGGTIIICSMNPTIEKIFNLSGLKRICKVANSEKGIERLLEVIS